MTPTEVVDAFCAAWGNKDIDAIVSFFTPDAVYHNIPMDPIVGPETIRTFIEGFAGGATSIEFKVHRTASDGSVVMNERTDIFVMGDKTIELPVMGVFEVTDDGKIAAWRDYFDLNQFTSQM